MAHMTEESPTCFIAMPISVSAAHAELYGDPQHWEHVMRHLFIPAVEQAGFRAVEPTAEGTSMIHGRIVQHLVESDLVLCDLSTHNPNVLFELGVRTSLNKPVAIVKDEHLSLPFDIQGLNTLAYTSALQPWNVEAEVGKLATHITKTVSASDSENPLWRHFGVAIAADRPAVDVSPADARTEILLERFDALERSLHQDLRAMPLTQTGEATVNRVADLLDGFTTGKKSYAQLADGSCIVELRTPESSAEEQRDRAAKAADLLATFGYVVRIRHTAPALISLHVAPEELATSKWLEASGR